MRTLVVYLIAMVLGILSQFAQDHSWLGTASLYTAFVIALLATLSLARDIALPGKLAKLLRVRRLALERLPTQDRVHAQSAPHAKVPRPAGPVGPMPVLQKQPQSANGDAIAIGTDQNAGRATDTN
jgi:hypothetical protein